MILKHMHTFTVCFSLIFDRVNGETASIEKMFLKNRRQIHMHAYTLASVHPLSFNFYFATLFSSTIGYVYSNKFSLIDAQ